VTPALAAWGAGRVVRGAASMLGRAGRAVIDDIGAELRRENWPERHRRGYVSRLCFSVLLPLPAAVVGGVLVKCLSNPLPVALALRPIIRWMQGAAFIFPKPPGTRPQRAALMPWWMTDERVLFAGIAACAVLWLLAALWIGRGRLAHGIKLHAAALLQAFGLLFAGAFLVTLAPEAVASMELKSLAITFGMAGFLLALAFGAHSWRMRHDL